MKKILVLALLGLFAGSALAGNSAVGANLQMSDVERIFNENVRMCTDNVVEDGIPAEMHVLMCKEAARRSTDAYLLVELAKANATVAELRSRNARLERDLAQKQVDLHGAGE